MSEGRARKQHEKNGYSALNFEVESSSRKNEGMSVVAPSNRNQKKGYHFLENDEEGFVDTNESTWTSHPDKPDCENDHHHLECETDTGKVDIKNYGTVDYGEGKNSSSSEVQEHNGYYALDELEKCSYDITGVPQSETGKLEVTVDEILDDLKLDFFHYRLLLITGLSYMADAVEVGFLSYASLCIKEEWNLNSLETSSITASMFIGSLVGNIFVWERVADTYGRRPACILGNVIVLFFGLCTIIAPNISILIVFLFLVGVGVGSVFVPFDLLAEFLPSKQRGNFLTNINYFWTMGSLFVSFGAWCVIDSAGWRALALFVSIPVVISLILTVIYLPESPRWLVEEHKPEKAIKVVLQAAVVNDSSLPPFTFATARSRSESVEKVDEESVWFELFTSKTYRPVTLKLMTLSLAWGVAYYAVVLLISRMYSSNSEGSPSEDIGTDKKSDTLNFDYKDIFLNALCEVVGIFVASSIIDRLGRQMTQGILYGVCALSHVLISLLYHNSTARNTLAALSRMCIIGGCGATVVMTPELFPTSLRVGGHALANSASRIGSILAPFIAENMAMSVSAICLILAAIEISATILSFTLPETAGRTLEKDSSDGEEVEEDTKEALQGKL